MEKSYTKQFYPRAIEPNFDRFSPRLRALILPILAEAWIKQQNPPNAIGWYDNFDAIALEPQWDKFSPHLQKLVLPILIQAYYEQQQQRFQPVSPLGIADTTARIHELRWGKR